MFNFPETLDYSVDFRPHLRLALAHATQIVSGDELNNGKRPNVYQSLPDDYVISKPFRSRPNQVCTINPDSYLSLLLQAAEVTLPDDYALTDSEIVALENSVSHEQTHGRKAQSWGNSHTINFYGVSYMLDEDKEPILWPFQITAGPLKKVHHAGVAAAPEEPSAIDLAVIRGLGYEQDIDAIRERAETEPSLRDGIIINSPLNLIHAGIKRLTLRAF